jgi:hypothetical protein
MTFSDFQQGAHNEIITSYIHVHNDNLIMGIIHSILGGLRRMSAYGTETSTNKQEGKARAARNAQLLNKKNNDE